MKVKLVEKSKVSEDELKSYTDKISKIKGFAVNALDVGMEKRIITIRLGGDYDDLTLVNPTIKDASENLVVYPEKEWDKNKIRKVIRHMSISVDTDNLGEVRFSSDLEKWKSEEEFMNDMGLFECVLAQRLIDSIDGININSHLRLYKGQYVAKKKPGRNERVIFQSPTGDLIFVKYKRYEELAQKGYKLL